MPGRKARSTPRLFIYRNSPSASGVLLAQALVTMGVPARKVSRPPRSYIAGDKVVGWGATYPLGMPEPPAINWEPVTGKLTEVRTLAAADVATVRFRTEPPPADANGDLWLGRAYQHHSGNDLLVPPARPGFWVAREAIVKELRVHVFAGVSIRVAAKVSSGPEAHEWIRSHTAGWRLDYAEGARNVRQKHRDAAKAAVAALHLTFGAVDIAETDDGRVIVLEVNRAPGFDGNGETVKKYAAKIAEWWRNNG